MMTTTTHNQTHSRSLSQVKLKHPRKNEQQSDQDESQTMTTITSHREMSKRRFINQSRVQGLIHSIVCIPHSITHMCLSPRSHSLILARSERWQKNISQHQRHHIVSAQLLTHATGRQGLPDNLPTNQLAVSQYADWMICGLVNSYTAN